MNWKVTAVCVAVVVFALISISTSADCDYMACGTMGMCSNDTVTGVFNCTCSDGSDGCYTDDDVDPCSTSPCQNGGQCTDNGDGTYMCMCSTGYEGADCETDTDDCAASPCQNEGVCTDDVGGYVCTCMYGYSGDNCETSDFSSLTCYYCNTLSMEGAPSDFTQEMMEMAMGGQNMSSSCEDGSMETQECMGVSPGCATIVMTTTVTILSGDKTTVTTTNYYCSEVMSTVQSFVNVTDDCMEAYVYDMPDEQVLAMSTSLEEAGFAEIYDITVSYGGCACTTDSCNMVAFLEDDDGTDDKEEGDDDDDDDDDDISGAQSSVSLGSVLLISIGFFLAAAWL